MELGRVLKEIRVSKSMKPKRSQGYWADKIGVSQSYLSQIEQDKKKPNPDVMDKICKVYGVPAAIVFFRAMGVKDVQKGKVSAFKQLKPLVDDLINEFFPLTQ